MEVRGLDWSALDLLDGESKLSLMDAAGMAGGAWKPICLFSGSVNPRRPWKYHSPYLWRRTGDDEWFVSRNDSLKYKIIWRVWVQMLFSLLVFQVSWNALIWVLPFTVKILWNLNPAYLIQIWGHQTPRFESLSTRTWYAWVVAKFKGTQDRDCDEQGPGSPHRTLSIEERASIVIA